MTPNKFSIFLLFCLTFLNGFSQSNGGITTGAASYCDSLNSGFLSLTFFTGQVQYWELSNDNGKTWTSTGNSTSTQSYNKLLKTTSYRAIVKDGAFPEDTSTVSTITVYVPGQGGKVSGGGLFCNDAGSGTLTISGAPGQVVHWESTTNNGASWDLISSTSSMLNYTSVPKSTSFRAIVQTVPGCPNDTSSSVSFTIDALSLAGTILNGDSVCPGTAGSTLSLSGYNGAILNWMSSSDNGKSWNSLSITDPALSYPTVTNTIWYKASVKNLSCPVVETSPAIVAVYDVTKTYAGPDVTITRFDPLTLQGTGNGTPSWNNSSTLNDASSFNPNAEPLNTTLYVLTVEDIHHCISIDTVSITVIVPIPTAITPNNDGVNDFFEIDRISDFPNNSLMVFNRWGSLVYKAAPYNNDWNGFSHKGGPLPDDQYYYVFDPGNGEKSTTNYILIKR